MDIDQLIGKFYNRLKKADIAGTEGKVAVQFNLTGKIMCPLCRMSILTTMQSFPVR